MVPHLRGLKDYKYMAVLGRGHFGKVLLAEDLTKKELVAIKVWREMEERERERGEREREIEERERGEKECVCRRFSEEIEVDSIVSKNKQKLSLVSFPSEHMAPAAHVQHFLEKNFLRWLPTCEMVANNFQPHKFPTHTTWKTEKERRDQRIHTHTHTHTHAHTYIHTYVHGKCVSDKSLMCLQCMGMMGAMQHSPFQHVP